MTLIGYIVSIWIYFAKDAVGFAGELDLPGVRTVIAESLGYLAAAGVSARVRLRVVRDRSSYRNVGGARARLSEFSVDAYQRRALRRDRLVHYIVGPTTEGYMTGYSTAGGVGAACGYRSGRSLVYQLEQGRIVTRGGAVSYSTGEYYNRAGASRLQHSAVAMAHELAHGLGAQHTTTATLLHPNALAYVDAGGGSVGIDARTINEVRECLI